MSENPRQTAGSQTLERGLRALNTLADADQPLSIAELAERLGVHRSNAYRILRTLEKHRYVVRDKLGLIRLGPRIAALARGVSPALQTAALPALTELANEVGMTAFITVLDDADVITLVSVEPTHSHPAVAQRPGARHSLTRGAPGHAIEASLSPEIHERLFSSAPISRAAVAATELGYALSHDEVVRGLTSIAVPLTITGEPPAALAIVTIGLPDDLDAVVAHLGAATSRISRNYH